MDFDNDSVHYACRGAKYDTIRMLLEKNDDALSVSKRNAHKKLHVDLLLESNIYWIQKVLTTWRVSFGFRLCDERWYTEATICIGCMLVAPPTDGR